MRLRATDVASCGDVPPARQAATLQISHDGPDDPDRLFTASTRPGSQIKTKT
jgi:hypothetical protein